MIRHIMVKPPKSSEVLMYGDRAKPVQRAEIINFDEKGKPLIESGGVAGAVHAQPKAVPKPAPKSTVALAAPSPKPAEQAKPAAKPKQSAPYAVKNPASAKEVSHALAVGTVGSMVDQMKAAAHAKGGMLSIQDLDAMQVEFAAKAKDMQKQLESAFVDYADARERMQFDQERDDPFYRLLVKAISSHFKEQPSRKSPSRRMLPGFFIAVDMLLGPDVVSSHQERCRSIIARLREDSGDDSFDWEMFYVERDALTVSLDAQVLIAAQFKDYDRRMNWFLTIVNSNLAPIDSTMSEGEQRWELAEPAFRRFMDGLLSSLRKVLSSDKGRERLVKRHGQENVAAALQVLKRLVTG